MDYLLWAGFFLSAITNVWQWFSGRKQAEALIKKTLAESFESEGAASKSIAEAVVLVVKELRDQIEELKTGSNKYFERVEYLEDYIKVLTEEVKELRQENNILRMRSKEQEILIVKYQNGKAGIL